MNFKIDYYFVYQKKAKLLPTCNCSMPKILRQILKCFQKYQNVHLKNL